MIIQKYICKDILRHIHLIIITKTYMGNLFQYNRPSFQKIQTLIPFIQADQTNSRQPILKQLSNKNMFYIPEQYQSQNFGDLEQFIQKLTIRSQQQKINPLKYPCSCIGLLIIKFKNKYVYGTGTLIADNIVLTCAHLIFNRDQQLNEKQAYQINFLIGVIDSKTVNIYLAKQWYIPQQYKSFNDKQCQNYDYTIIKLHSKNLSEHLGYLGLNINNSKINDQIQIFGFSRKKFEAGIKSNFYLRGNKCQYKFLSNNKIQYSGIIANKQQEGSAILIKVGSTYKIIGLNNKVQRNQGILLGQNFKRDINKWIIKKSIQLNFQNINPQNIRKMVNITKAKSIKTLNLNNNNITNQGVRYLSQSNWPELTNLHIAASPDSSKPTKITSQGIKYLLNTNWQNLNQLNLRNNDIGVQGMQYLCKILNWPKLQKLNISKNKIKAEGVKYLCSANWSKLKILNLQSNHLGDQAIQYLSQSKWVGLQTLDLYSNNITARGVYYLVKCIWPNLIILHLGGNKIKAEGMKFLVQGNWPKLSKLQLYYNQIGDLGIKQLSKSNWLNLTTLHLKSNNIGAMGALHLSKLNYQKLQILNLTNNNIGDLGVQYLCNNSRWQNLQLLNLNDNQISNLGLKLLRNTWPKLGNSLFLQVSSIQNYYDNPCK